MAKVFIGTSGWVYLDWEGIFYPKSLPANKKLEFYSRHFKTTEINYSFYHLPRSSTFQKWYKETPSNFVFAVKVSRFISHIKKLKAIEKPWQEFYQNALFLKEKLGPLLLQLPPSFKCNSENFQRIKNFLSFIQKNKTKKFRLAIEVRNSSFQNFQFFNLLKKHNTALVISDSAYWPKIEKPELADFIYLRFHGPTALFASAYSDDELRRWAEKIKKWLKKTTADIFVYFNNDVAGYAVENARTLLRFLQK